MGEIGKHTLRITHMRLENWRNFRLVDVDLQQRAFLVGPNAVGKSNFLDALRFLRTIAAAGGGFQEAVSARGGVSRIRSLAARQQSDVVIGIALGTDDEPEQWKYEIGFRQENRRPVLVRESIEQRGMRVLVRPDDKDREDPERLTQTALEQVNTNREFRSVVEFLLSIRYLHIVPQLVREPERSVGRSNDPFGGDFLEQIMTTPEKTRAARLRRILMALRAAVPQLINLEAKRDARGIAHLLGKYEHWRPQGAWQSEADLSDGTLRLLGLLWALLDGSGPLLLEEPELSLHPEVVRRLPQLFHRAQRGSRRQIVLATHSSEMLNDEGIGLDEVLLLEPQVEGTSVRLASALSEVRELLEGGVSLGDAVMPRTRPSAVEQLALFVG